MQKKLLIKPVSVTGPNFFGMQSRIDFLPAEKPGWYLRTLHKGDVPINHSIAHSKKGRIQLQAGGTFLNVYEHIGALRTLLGIDQVIIVVYNSWPPYIGGAFGYYKKFQVTDAWIQTTDNFPTIEPKRMASCTIANHLQTETKITFNQDELLVKVCSQWKPLPKYEDVVSSRDLLDTQFVYRLIIAQPQGFPHYRRSVARALKLFGWPNMDYISWAKDFTPLEAAYEWWAHGVQDTYGCLSLCHHIAYPHMNYYRHCAGHKQDLLIIKQAFS